MGAHVSGSNTKLASLTYGMMPAAPGYAVEDAHAMTDIVEFSEPDLWDGPELAVPELVDELELVVVWAVQLQPFSPVNPCKSGKLQGISPTAVLQISHH